MSTISAPAPKFRTLADFLRYLGDIPADRVRFHPSPGQATVADVLAVLDHEDIRCELIHGVLVEKPMAYFSSCLAIAIAAFLRNFVLPRNLGLVSGSDGMLELFTGLVRAPDVAFVGWDRLPGRRMPMEPIPSLVPDLAVEVLSPSNTPGEMSRKRRDYFAAGVRLLWIVDPKARTVAVFTSADPPDAVLTEDQTLDGGAVLPGFTLPLRELFAELDRQGPATA